MSALDLYGRLVEAARWQNSGILDAAFADGEVILLDRENPILARYRADEDSFVLEIPEHLPSRVSARYELEGRSWKRVNSSFDL